MNKDKKIRRAPIIMDKNTVALIHVFHKHDDFDDMWMHDIEKYILENYEQYEEAAKQFINQLDGHWCVLFMEHLTKHAFKTMTEEDPQAFTKEAAEKLIKELQEITDKREK